MPVFTTNEFNRQACISKSYLLTIINEDNIKIRDKVYINLLPGSGRASHDQALKLIHPDGSFEIQFIEDDGKMSIEDYLYKAVENQSLKGKLKKFGNNTKCDSLISDEKITAGYSLYGNDELIDYLKSETKLDKARALAIVRADFKQLPKQVDKNPSMSKLNEVINKKRNDK